MSKATRPTLYQFAECHEAALVRRLLRQADVPFEAVTMPLGDRSIVRSKFKTEASPVLVDGKFTSSDLGAIVQHVKKSYGA